MQVVILAGGKGTRMGKITQNTPKPLVKLNGKTLLEYKLETLPKKTSEVIIVIGYLGEQIKKYIGSNYKGIPITYIEQKEQLGTGDALFICKEILHGPFMVLMSDDLYNKNDLETISNIPKSEWSTLAFREKHNPNIVVMNIDCNNNFTRFSKNNGRKYSLVYTGACVLTPEIFTVDMEKVTKEEYGLPQTFAKFVDKKSIKVFETTDWNRVSTMDDVSKIEKDVF
jgi:bifunctional UDP-N-acetylglucosamine pyrophosphorylase/glucosamine-1-phosphate N-acetyltransferase